MESHYGKRAFNGEIISSDVDVAANKHTFSDDIDVSLLKVLKDKWCEVSSPVI